MNKYILIKVNNNINRFINKCNSYNIELFNIRYIDKNNIIAKIEKDKYDIIKKYNYYSDITIYKNLGLDYLKDKILKLKYFILLFISCLISMYIISNIIIKIEIIHSNKEIRELVNEELNNYGITPLSYKKNFYQLDEIKNKILENNKNKLEWISITNIGMKYVVRIEERIIDDIKEDKEYCDVISKKEALITNIFSDKGEILVSVNDLVKQNDILITGTLKNNEEIKNYTCANGIIMGKVWYKTDITIKREYEKKVYTGKKRYNILINHKILRNNKYKFFDKKYILKNKFFSIYKEIKYDKKKYKYKEKEGIDKALLEIDKKLKEKIGSKGKILDKKILNKNINNKEIRLDVFVITEESIGKVVELEKIQ